MGAGDAVVYAVGGMTTPRPSVPVVLVVDDDDYVHGTLTAALRRFKPTIVRATTAAEGERLAREHRPDLAIIDVGLPDSDGYVLTARLREEPELADLRIIILTGHLPDAPAASAAGADAILGKPFRVQEFLDTVARLLGLTSSSTSG
jgi:DNA-binding response OmpR family regulator